MSVSQPTINGSVSRIGLLALLLLWMLVVLVAWQSSDPLTALVWVGALPFAVAGGAYVLSRTSLEMAAFTLPGLLIFFKQNDALIRWFGGVPVNDILGLIVFLYLLVRLRKEELIDTYRAASILLLTLVGLMAAFVISWVYAVEIHESRRETLTFAKDLVFALLIAMSIRNLRDFRAFVGWLILATTFTAFAMILETAAGRPIFPDRVLETWQNQFRSGGSSLESVPFVATMISIGAFAALSLAIRRPQARLILTGAAVLGVAAVLVSITRSVVVVLGLTTLFMLWRLRRERFFPFAALGAGVAAVIVFLTLPASTVEKFTALQDTSADRTVERRVDYVKIGADLFAQSPFLGIGAGNYPPRYASNDYKFVRALATERRDLHNIYVQYIVEIGIAGALLFYAQLITIGAMLWQGTKARTRELRHYSEAMLVGYFVVCVQLLFLASKSFLGIWILTAAAIAIARLCAAERREGVPHS